MNSQFRDFPWKKIDSDEIRKITALTFLEERQLALWLAKELYTGRGEIVDAGAFMGGSALSLGIGLQQNLRVPPGEKMGRVHAYDVFMWSPWMGRTFVLPPSVQLGTSFLGKFHDAIKAYEDFIVIHPGDIANRKWKFGPIEILDIDCAKTFRANVALVDIFFENLMPGAFIVQQDYAVVSRLIWIHATMEYFWNKLEDMGTTSIGGSTIFRLVEPITRGEALACIEALREGCLDLARRAADRYDQSDRRHAAIRSSIAGFIKSPLPLSTEITTSRRRRRVPPAETKKLQRRRKQRGPSSPVLLSPS